MKQTTKLIIVIIIMLLVLFGIFSATRKQSDISKLYAQKGIIVTQKADLLRQDLAIRNQIDTVNKDIMKFDTKLDSLINPVDTGLEQVGKTLTPIQQMDNFISLS